MLTKINVKVSTNFYNPHSFHGVLMSYNKVYYTSTSLRHVGITVIKQQVEFHYFIDII